MKKVRIILTLTAFVFAVAGSFATLLPVAESQGKPSATSAACPNQTADSLFEGSCFVNGSGAQCHLSDGTTLAYRITNCSTILTINQ